MRTEQSQWSPAEGWKPRLPGDLGASAQAVLVFGDFSLPGARECLEALARFYPHARLLGCRSAGEIQGVALSDGTLAATVVAFEHTRVEAARAPIGGPGGGFEAGAQVAASLPAEGLRHVFVLAPGNTTNCGAVVGGLNSALPPGVTASGGFAGAGGEVHGSSVWCGGEPECSAVVALGFYGARLRTGRGSGGGWHPFGPERRITRSARETIYEFDGVSALGLYKQYLGKYAANLPFSALRFPMGLRVRDGDPWGVRVINGMDERNGGLTFDCDVPDGGQARFMMGNAENLIAGAAEAAGESQDELGCPRNSPSW